MQGDALCLRPVTLDSAVRHLFLRCGAVRTFFLESYGAVRCGFARGKSYGAARFS